MSDLLQRGIAAVRAGQAEEARRLLAQAIRANPRDEAAWLWMSAVARNNQERIRCLQRVLAINPDNELAKRGLKALGIAAEEVAQAAAPEQKQTAQPDAAPTSVPPVTSAPGGVPLPDGAAVEAARREAQKVLEALQRGAQAAKQGVRWARPGEKAIRPSRLSLLDPRRNPMVAAIGGSVVIVILTVVLVANLSRTIRAWRAAEQQAAQIGEASATPTPSLTPRPTRTPTPPDQAITPEPSLPAGDAPRGNLRYGLTPTPPYIRTPHPSSRYFQEGQAAYYEGRYEEAVALIRQAREAGEDSVDGYFYEGMALARLGELEAAIAVLREGLALDGGFAPLHAALGFIHAQQGAHEQSRLENETARQLDPRLLMSYLNLAELALQEGDLEAAQAEVAAAREQVSRYDVNLLVMEGRIHLAAGRTRDALAVANLAAYIDPSSEEVALLQGQARLAMGLGESAMIGLENYLERVNPTSAKAWTLLGTAYTRQGRFADGQEAFAIALGFTSNPAEVLTARGLAFIEQGDYRQAYTDLSTVLASEESVEAYLGRAKAALALGDGRQALSDLEPVRAARTGDPGVETLYVRALLAEERHAEVIEAATSALTLALSEEQQAQVLEARGRAYYAVGEFEAALEDINQSMALEMTGTRLYYRGLIYQALGRTDAALFDLEWVVFWGMIFDYPFVTDAARRIEVLYVTQAFERTPTATPTITPTPSATATGSTSASPGP